MSTTTQVRVLTGTWQLDPVHSAVDFEVALPGRHVQGRVPRGRRASSTVDGEQRPARGEREGLERRRQGREPERAPAVARLLRRRAASRASLHRRGHRPRRQRGRGARRDHDQGRHPARRGHRHGQLADGRPLRQRPDRSPAHRRRRPDRVRRQLEHAASERRAGARGRGSHRHRPAVREVGLAHDEDPRHLRQPPPRLPQHEAAARSGRARARRRRARALGRAEGGAAVRRGRRSRRGAGGRLASSREAIAGADAVLFATPEYNSSIPGAAEERDRLGFAADGDGALRNKPVAVIGASTGMFGAVWAQAELRKVLASAGARVLDGELPVPAAHTRFDEGGARRRGDPRASRRGRSSARRPPPLRAVAA